LTSPAPAASRSRSRKAGTPKGVWVLVVGAFLIALVFLVLAHPNPAELLESRFLWRKLALPVSRTVLFVSMGLLVGQLIEGLGWTTRLGRLAWPLINWARLPGQAGAAFTSAFVSGVLANTMLYTSWQEGHVDRKGLILSNLLNASLPAYVLHMPTTLFIVISLTGRAGAWYVGLTLAAAVIRMVGVAAVSRVTMPVCEACRYDGTERTRPWREVWAETWPKFKVRLWRIVLVIVPVYLGVALVAESGFFGWLEKILASWVVSSVVPVEAMSVVIFSVVAEFTSGFAAAGALLASGALTVKAVVAALLIGNVIATPVRALRHQLPHYMGIYSPALGTELLAIGQTTRVISVILVGTAFLLLY